MVLSAPMGYANIEKIYLNLALCAGSILPSYLFVVDFCKKLIVQCNESLSFCLMLVGRFIELWSSSE